MKTTLEDRKRGVLAGLAIGDALGAGYEFGPPLAPSQRVYMKGGGPFRWAPGEWTDDTSMAIPLASRVAAGWDLLDPKTVEFVYQQWRAWSWDAPDVGGQTRRVLSDARNAKEAREFAREWAVEHPGNAGGNGCIMRTAPIALAYLGDGPRCAKAAETYAALTHGDPAAIETAVDWTLGVAYAVTRGRYPSWVNLDWRHRMHAARPEAYTGSNGYAPDAADAAVAAIVAGRGKPRESLEAAVRGGGDTDTVAAITGALVGAVNGLSGFPAEWVELAHGWPGVGLLELPTVRV